LGGEFGIAAKATASQWRVIPLSTKQKYCEITKVSVYGAVQNEPVPVWHGQLRADNLDVLFDECALLGIDECVGIALETDSTNPRAALISQWVASASASTGATTTYTRLEVDGTYAVDEEQRGKGVRLGDCKMGVYESEITMPYVGDWDFKVKTKADTSLGSFASDWMDIYIRPDATDQFVLVARHLNDADHYTPIRISNSGRFGLKLVSSSSTESLSRHMRIERSPIARSEVSGHKHLTYRLGNNPCLSHRTDATRTTVGSASGDEDTQHALDEAGAGIHAAYCPKALFSMDKWTGQLSVRHTNVFDVRKAKEFTLKVHGKLMNICIAVF
jgi:hypothetical protein